LLRYRFSRRRQSDDTSADICDSACRRIRVARFRWKRSRPGFVAGDAKGWVGKPVYSNDGKELRRVTRLDSSAENKATQLYTDIGRTTGAGKHQVILPVQSDRIVIDMTATQASKLPKMNY
jgi:hypothetical protein